MDLNRLRRGASPARRIIRELLALAFWTHAFFIFGVLPLPHPEISEFSRYSLNILLAIFILNYSLFTDNGWWSVTFDLLFIYFLPFIYVKRLAWIFSKATLRRLRSQVKWQNPGLVVSPTVTAVQPQTSTEPNVQKPATEGSHVRWTHRIGRLFYKFALLWAILIVTVNSKPFLVVAILVCIIGALRAMAGMWGMFAGGPSWVDKLEFGFAQQIRGHIAKLSAWSGGDDTADVRNAINVLKLLGATFNFLYENAAMLKSWAFTTSMIVSVPFYCYVSFLFSCSYFGIAKLANLHFTLAEAFVDSLFIPFAFSSLPATLPIRIVGGIQCLCVTLVGYNLVFRHLGNHLDRMTRAAASLRDPLQSADIRATMTRVENLLSGRS